MSRGTIAAMAAALCFVTTSAKADATKDECIESNSRAQDLRHDGKLHLARAEARLCSDPACPALVRKDCAKLLEELDKIQPTIVFDVQSASGADVAGVTMTIDGKHAEQLDGTPIPLDPGQYVFAFEAAGRPKVERTFVIVEGENARREHIVMDDVAAGGPARKAAGGAASAARDPSVVYSSGSLTTPQVLGLLAVGAGVVGLTVGSIFGLMAVAAKDQQQVDCPSAGGCTPSGQSLAFNDHSTATADGAISTAGLLTGGVLLIGGAIVFFTAGTSSPEHPATPGMVVTPSVGTHGGGFTLRREF